MQEYFIEVGTSNYKENLYRRLSDLRSVEGLPFELYELKNDSSYLVRCVYSTFKGPQKEDRLILRIYNYYFARALSEVIFQEWERFFIKKVLKKEYSFDFSEINKLIDKCWYAQDETKIPLSNLKKNILIKSILEFLDTHQRFNIEGFMNFRADHYKRELRKQIARAVNNYILDQEHQDFITVLKKFHAKQTTIFPTINLIIKHRGEIQFFDEQGRNISRECLEEYNRADIELYEDFLISIILKCAPQTLVVHKLTEKHAHTMQIIQEVFEGKVSICEGCYLCEQSH
ncbi:MAG: hypothetical protein GX207_07495 [Peptococcaceae bacterium]|nr:hypothetical protein [Peptococcaceae bacterium]